MNTQEALKLLELQENATKEEIQSAFRKMAKKHHPDLNKDDPEAEAKFKKINEAHQLLTNPKPQNNRGNQENPGWQDIFNQHFGGMPFGGRNQHLHQVQVPTTVISVNLTFAESVLGCTKDIITDQYIHCADCNGTGGFKLADDCKYCNGQGNRQANFSRGNIVFMQPCDKCNGTGKQLKQCNPCSGKGYVTKNGPVNLTIPGGLVNGNVLRTHGTILQVSVESDPDMILREGDVVSTIELSLLEALEGTKRTVRTIKGEMSLKIPAKVKNKDNIVVHGYGVPSVNGSHIFDVRINYPENVDSLIELLENNQ
jgi:DnaJ-class molecular chaperone